MKSTVTTTTGSPFGRPPAAHARYVLNPSEQMRNHREIESIARQLARPLAEIAALYADVYADLKSRALVVDYLPVLVARRVCACYPAANAALSSESVRTGGAGPELTAWRATH